MGETHYLSEAVVAAKEVMALAMLVYRLMGSSISNNRGITVDTGGGKGFIHRCSPFASVVELWYR